MNQSSVKVQDIERGDRLREERERLGLTQPVLAAYGGVKKGSQILYEKGSPPTADYLAAVSAVGIDVLYVLLAQRTPGHDLDVLCRAIELIELGLAEAGRVATPVGKAEMVTAAYEMLRENGERASTRVLQLLK